jgi:hypothetical protein
MYIIDGRPDGRRRRMNGRILKMDNKEMRRCVPNPSVSG